MLGPNQNNVGQWREEYARRMLQLDFEPVPNTAFHSTTENIVDGLRMVKSAFSPGFTVRNNDLIKKGDDSFAFVVSKSAKIEIIKAKQNLRLGHGDGAFLQVSEPGLLGADCDFNYLALMIPAQDLPNRALATNGFRKRVPKTSEGLQLLRSYVLTLEKGKRTLSPQSLRAIQQHLYDLVTIACDIDVVLGESRLGAIAAARLCAAQEIASAQYARADFSIWDVAQSLKVSPRYIQRLFHTTGKTFTDHVNELRLDRAMALLTETAGTRKRVSDIAFQVGYSDLSYFDRNFKRYFGSSPSDIRATTREPRPHERIGRSIERDT